MNVGEMQRKLSQGSTQDKERKFYDLYDFLYDQDWLRLAHDYVKQNAGSITAGCDGINMSTFDENLGENLQQLIKEVQSETFKPDPVRRVYIPKPNGKTRPLGRVGAERTAELCFSAPPSEPCLHLSAHTALQKPMSSPTFDAKDCFGITHLAYLSTLSSDFLPPFAM